MATFWPHTVYILATIRLHFVYILPTFWLHFDFNLATFLLTSDCILTTFWLHSDFILTTFCLHSDYFLPIWWLRSGYILATFLLYSGYILDIIWLHFDYIMHTFCFYFDYILTTSRNILTTFWLFWTISDWLTMGARGVKGVGADITNFWSIILDDHWSKTIYIPFNLIFLHLPLIEILAQGQKARFSFLQLCWNLQGRVLIQLYFYLPFLNFAGWLVAQSLLSCLSHLHVYRTSE